MVSPSAPASIRALVAGVVFLASIQMVVLGLSLAGVRFGAPAAWLTLGLGAALAGTVAKRLRVESRPTASRGALRWFGLGFGSVLGSVLGLGFALWAASVWARLLWIAARRPVLDWDGLYYHVPALHGWVQAGRVHWLEGFADIPFANGYPMGVEVWSFWLHFLTGSSRWVDATNLLLWPLGALGLVVAAEEAGAKSRGFAAAGWAWVPAFVAFGATCYADPAFACTFAAFFALLLRTVRRGPRSTRTEAMVLGAALGLMMATKGTGLLLGVVFLGFAVFAYARRHADLPGRLWISVVFAGLVGGYWPVRNLWYTQNPFFPVGLGGGWIPGYDARAMVDLNLPAWLAAWPEPLRVLRAWWPVAPVESTGFESLGWAWVLALLPALVAAALVPRRRGVPRWPMVAAVVTLVAQPGAWWPRLTLWLLALAVPACAVAFERGRPWVRGLLAAGLVLGALEVEATVAEQIRATRSGPTSSLAFVAPAMAQRPDLRGFLRSPHIARSGWSRMGTLLGGALALPLDARRIETLPDAPTPAQVAALEESGVEWVVWDRQGAGALPPALEARPRVEYVQGDDLDLALVRLDDQSE